MFLPVITLSGLAGRLFELLGLTYVLAVMASLVVAVTVTPALALLLLPPRHTKESEPPVIHWTRQRYEALLLMFMRSATW